MIDQSAKPLHLILQLRNLLQRYASAWVAFGACILLWSGYQRFPHGDDAWLGEQAFFLARDGYVHSNLFRGLHQYEDIQLIYHKLWIWQGALITKWASFNMYWLKGSSAVYAVLFLFCFRSLLQHHYHKRYGTAVVTLVIGLAVAYHPFFISSFMFRPEILLLWLGMCSYWLLVTYLNTPKVTGLVLGAGILTGLAMLTHLNGAAYAMAGGLLLLWHRLWRAFFLFAIATSLVFSLYFWEPFFYHRWDLFWKQFFPVVQSGEVLTQERFWMKLVFEGKRYFAKPAIAIFSLVFLWFLWMGRRSLPRKAALYTISLLFFLGLFAIDKSWKYAQLLLPWMLMLMLPGLYQTLHGRLNPTFRLVAMLVLVLGFASQWFANLHSTQKNYPHNLKIAQFAQQFDLNGKKVLAPMHFVFHQASKSDIQSLKSYRLMQAQQEKPLNPFMMAKKFDREVLVFRASDFEHFRMKVPDAEAPLKGISIPEAAPYRLVAVEGHYYIFM